MSTIKQGEIDVNNSPLLQHKDRSDLIIYADICMDTKKKNDSKSLWPPDAQTWRITEVKHIWS